MLVADGIEPGPLPVHVLCRTPLEAHELHANLSAVRVPGEHQAYRTANDFAFPKRRVVSQQNHRILRCGIAQRLLKTRKPLLEPRIVRSRNDQPV